ncbi:hypothetical protein V502_02667 [Pseudogymnoascus sp. VKM F-4520 (FW-2644)]|nr:hypothetical protein V502_02667 [Pseudogymnoascus sp. VKM F-4520 (FW-2644)]
MAPRGWQPIYRTEEERAVAKKAQSAERQRKFTARRRVKQENEVATNTSVAYRAQGRASTSTSHKSPPSRAFEVTKSEPGADLEAQLTYTSSLRTRQSQANTPVATISSAPPPHVVDETGAILQPPLSSPSSNMASEAVVEDGMSRPSRQGACKDQCPIPDWSDGHDIGFVEDI